MTKLVFIMLFCVCANAQQAANQRNALLIHFSNADDRTEMETVLAKAIDINPFVEIATSAGNTDVQIQVVFFDSELVGVLEPTAENQTQSDIFLEEWYQTHDDIDKRIIFFFVKKSGTYEFESMLTTKALADGQLPKIVVDFISQQILNDKTRSYVDIVKLGINAIKNAFDQRFLENLVSNAEPLFDDNQYFKGYSCIDFDYYFLESIPHAESQKFGCSRIFLRESDVSYNEVVVEQPPLSEVSADESATLMDFASGKKLRYKKQNSITGAVEEIALTAANVSNLFFEVGENQYRPVTELNYKYDYFDFTSPATTFTSKDDLRLPSGLKSRLNTIFWRPSEFKAWKYDGPTGSPLLFEETRKACGGESKVKVSNGRIRTRVDQVDERHGISTYSASDFRLAQPTWCNVFARVLSRKVFGMDAFPAKSCKGLISEEFSVKKELYVQITGKNRNPEFIWGLINKGYPIYFVDGGHIETGFPDNYAHTAYKHRHDIDSRYNTGQFNSKYDSNTLIEDPSQEQKIVVGAGASVGYKQSWDNYSWLHQANVYIYLGYLKTNY